MSNPAWWPQAHEAWNCQEPGSRRINGVTWWWARAWPWPDQKPYVGMGETKQRALDALRDMLAKECGYDLV
jgi:hypothetical protein